MVGTTSNPAAGIRQGLEYRSFNDPRLLYTTNLAIGGIKGSVTQPA